MDPNKGIFGKTALLWVCTLSQAKARPPADFLYNKAYELIEQVRSSEEAQLLPIIAADDGLFALAALMDEVAMSMPDLRPFWGARPLQSVWWKTNNAGIEFFERLKRVKEGEKSVLFTYISVLGLGFRGCYGLPGVDNYPLYEIRRELAIQIGADPDRDWNQGIFQTFDPHHPDLVSLANQRQVSIWVARGVAGLFLFTGLVLFIILALRFLE